MHGVFGAGADPGRVFCGKAFEPVLAVSDESSDVALQLDDGKLYCLSLQRS